MSEFSPKAETKDMEFVTTSPEVKGAGKEADPCPM